MVLQKIELGKTYMYNRMPHTVVALTDWGAKILPVGRVNSYVDGETTGLNISANSWLPVATEKDLAVVVPEDGKKRRGRPKGSMNKKVKDITLSEVVALTKTMKKRGRPKGSKNKVKK